jgi:Fic family protein
MEYTPNIPGRLVKTRFLQNAAISGIPQVIAEEGTAFVPDPLPPAWASSPQRGSETADELAAASLAIGRLEGRIASLPNPLLLLWALRAREVKRSSEIEDTVATIAEVERASAGDRRPSAQAVEVLRNRQAIELAVESNLPMGRVLIRQAHQQLMKNTRGQQQVAGRFRVRQSYIGGAERGFGQARFIPPPPEQVEGLMAQLELFLRGEVGADPRRPWLIDLGLAHYQFEAIHPFDDGNGRLGRMLVNVLPAKRGWLKFPLTNISEYALAHRDEYTDSLLAVSKQRDWGRWLRFFLRAVADQAARDHVRTDEIHKLREGYIDRLRGDTSTFARPAIDLLFTSPIITSSQIAQRLDVTKRTAFLTMRRLAERGIVTETPWNGREIAFVANDLLEAVDRDDTPPVPVVGTTAPAGHSLP